MENYVLLKDLPDAKAGTVFRKRIIGTTAKENIELYDYIYISIKNKEVVYYNTYYVENSPEWFMKESEYQSQKMNENKTKNSLFICPICGNKEDNLTSSMEGYPTVHCCKCKNVTSLHIKTAFSTEIPNKEYELWRKTGLLLYTEVPKSPLELERDIYKGLCENYMTKHITRYEESQVEEAQNIAKKLQEENKTLNITIEELRIQYEFQHGSAQNFRERLQKLEVPANNRYEKAIEFCNKNYQTLTLSEIEQALKIATGLGKH